VEGIVLDRRDMPSGIAGWCIRRDAFRRAAAQGSLPAVQQATSMSIFA